MLHNYNALLTGSSAYGQSASCVSRPNMEQANFMSFKVKLLFSAIGNNLYEDASRYLNEYKHVYHT